MVDRNIVNKLGLSKDELDQQVSEMFTEQDSLFLEQALQEKVDSHLPGAIIKGKIVTQIGNDVIVEVGLKSEGVVDAAEFDSSDDIEPGKDIEVLLEDADSEGGVILLSKRKADRIRSWERIIDTKREGDVVTGRAIRRIKGGLLVDIGVPVFLPASQVDIRKPGDISRFIGRELECKILKIDIEGRNIVVSRRKLIEEERKSSKEKILVEIELGQWRKGVVKNIADFGVFVDLGGLDGLLHISDLSWGRISHPSEVVKIDEEIECVVIGVDKENEKISLGLKQKTASPWEKVESRYPEGKRVKGKVVNVMNYGVFVRLEDGIEGLVHISEMSWTRRLSHPSEMLQLGDDIEVIVLNVNKGKQEISLGLKQTEANPWLTAAQKYPPGTIVTAKARALTNFGAFVEIEEGIDGMIHISDLSWTRKYNHPSEALQRDKDVKCVVLDVDQDKQRVSLGIKQLTEDPWITAIPEKYVPGQIIKGKVTKLTNFGAFVELEPELEGLLHISELADHKIDSPRDIVSESDEVEVKILKVDTDARKIGLSLRRAQWAAEDQTADKQPKDKPAAPDTILGGVQIPAVTQEQAQTEQADQSAATPAEPEAEPAEEDKAGTEAEPAEEDKAAADTAPPADSPQTSEPEDQQTQPDQTGSAEPEAESVEEDKAGTEADEQANIIEPEQSADEQDQDSQGDDKVDPQPATDD